MIVLSRLCAYRLVIVYVGIDLLVTCCVCLGGVDGLRLYAIALWVLL